VIKIDGKADYKDYLQEVAEMGWKRLGKIVFSLLLVPTLILFAATGATGKEKNNESFQIVPLSTRAEMVSGGTCW